MKGRKAHLDRLAKLSGAQFERRIGQALFVGGDRIRVEAQISITAGAVSGRNHVASQPGAAPHNDTGVLANNIEVNQTGTLLVEVSSNAPYSAALEEGSSRSAGTTARPGYKRAGPVKYEYGDSKTEARPFMGPARDKMRGEVEKLIVAVVEKLSKSG